jgi:hypothetical protein
MNQFGFEVFQIKREIGNRVNGKEPWANLSVQPRKRPMAHPGPIPLSLPCLTATRAPPVSSISFLQSSQSTTTPRSPHPACPMPPLIPPFKSIEPPLLWHSLATRLPQNCTLEFASVVAFSHRFRRDPSAPPPLFGLFRLPLTLRVTCAPPINFFGVNRGGHTQLQLTVVLPTPATSSRYFRRRTTPPPSTSSSPSSFAPSKKPRHVRKQHEPHHHRSHKRRPLSHHFPATQNP